MNDQDIAQNIRRYYFIDTPPAPVGAIRRRSTERQPRWFSRRGIALCLTLATTGLALAVTPATHKIAGVSSATYSYIVSAYQHLLAPIVVPASAVANNAKFRFNVPERIGSFLLTKTTQMGTSAESYMLDYRDGHGCAVNMTVSKIKMAATTERMLSALPGGRQVFGEDAKGLSVLGSGTSCQSLGGFLSAFFSAQ